MGEEWGREGYLKCPAKVLAFVCCNTYILFACLLRRVPFPLRASANEILGYELFLLRTLAVTNLIPYELYPVRTLAVTNFIPYELYPVRTSAYELLLTNLLQYELFPLRTLAYEPFAYELYLLRTF